MMSQDHTLGVSGEMYLKSICELMERSDYVPISRLADRLAISTVSATEMIHRMKDEGWVEHLPYRGVRLTQSGRRIALAIIRRHRLWECFLAYELGLPWEDSHELACQLEHAVGGEVTEALAERLGRPTTCPHGNPIPTMDGRIQSPHGLQLDEMQIGQTGVLRRVRPESTPLLNYLAERQLKPGTTVHLEEIDPFGGLRTVRVEERSIALGQEIATHIVIDTQSNDDVESDGK